MLIRSEKVYLCCLPPTRDCTYTDSDAKVEALLRRREEICNYVLLPLSPLPLPSPLSLPRPELLLRQQKGLIPPKTYILAVDDPRPNIGSGSAALNAIICVAEYLAAQDGSKVRGH